MRSPHTKRAPSFRQWLESAGNPLRNASDSVKYSAYEALRSAFEAGELHERTRNADVNARVFE